MSRSRPKYTPEPRIWTAFQVATRLGKSETWFRGNLKKLRDEGFPEYDLLLQGWDADAVEAWMDRRSGLMNDAPDNLVMELEEWSP